MSMNKEKHPESGMMLVLFVLINAIVLNHGFLKDQKTYWLLLITIPLLLLSIKFRNKLN